MRGRVGAVGAIVALALVAGWRVGTNGPGDGTAQAPEAPEQGGVLRLALERPPHLDPALARTVPPSEAVVADLLFDSLTAPGERAGQVEPAVAASWESSDDQRSWRFHVRPGARFSDDEEITAEDVVATLERIATKGSGSPLSPLLAPVQGYRALAVDGSTETLAGVTAPERTVVRIDLDRPLATLPALLSAPGFGIVPGATARVGDTMFDQAPTGSGPFALADGERLSPEEERLRLVRSHGGRTLLAGVELQLYDDQPAASEAFERGRADWAMVPDDALEDAEGGPGRVEAVPLPATLFYGLRLTAPTLADPRMREAVVRAVDREKIAEEVYGRALEPRTGVVPEVAGGGGDPCNGRCDFDPERAEALVKEVFPLGAMPEVFVDTDDGALQQDVSRRIVADLRAAGINAVQRPRPFPDFQLFASVGPGQEILRLGWTAAYASPDAFLSPLFGSLSPDNAVGLRDPAADQALQQAGAEPEPEARARLLAEAERAAMAQVPVLPLGQFVAHVTVGDQVRDLSLRPGGTFDATRVWLAGDER